MNRGRLTILGIAVAAAVATSLLLLSASAPDGNPSIAVRAGDAFGTSSGTLATDVQIPIGVPTAVAVWGDATNGWKTPLEITGATLVTSRGTYRVTGSFTVNLHHVRPYAVIPVFSRRYLAQMLGGPTSSFRPLHVPRGPARFWTRVFIDVLPTRLEWIDIRGFELSYRADGRRYQQFCSFNLDMRVVSRAQFNRNIHEDIAR